MNQSQDKSIEEQDEESKVNTIESKKNLKMSHLTNEIPSSGNSIYVPQKNLSLSEYETIPLETTLPKLIEARNHESIHIEMNKSPKKETETKPSSKCPSCLII